MNRLSSVSAASKLLILWLSVWSFDALAHSGSHDHLPSLMAQWFHQLSEHQLWLIGGGIFTVVLTIALWRRQQGRSGQNAEAPVERP
jgi:hypothetical protein